MKFSKTISIEQSHLNNVQEIMLWDGQTFAQVCRKLIGLGLQKYMENHNKDTVITTTVISDKPDMEESPEIETIQGDKWDQVGKKSEEVLEE